eukprot:366398-Chlamydomonas_euryale.AAC.8
MCQCAHLLIPLPAAWVRSPARCENLAERETGRLGGWGMSLRLTDPMALLTWLNLSCARISWIWKSCVRADVYSRFVELLQGTNINRPDEVVLRRIR